MARKKKQSPFEDLIEITSMLPWWAGVILAVIAYFVCHHYATAEMVQVAKPGQVAHLVTSQIGKMLAMAGQYLLPLAFLLGAVISAYGRHRRNTLFDDVQKSTSASALNGMTWQEFEMLVGEAFRRKGYSVAETGGGDADGGVDLLLGKDGEKFLVQCKQWKAYKVGVTTVREFCGVMIAGGAVGGFVVTSGVFTQEAKSFAKGINIELIDGTELTAMIKKIHQSPQAIPATAPRTVKNAPVANPDPLCPKCGGLMTMRTAKQGANIGKTFWGCNGFPQCRGVIAID